MEIPRKIRTAILVFLMLLPIPGFVASIYFKSFVPIAVAMVLIFTVPRFLWLKGVEKRLSQGEGILGPLDLTGKKAAHALVAGAISAIALLGAVSLQPSILQLILFFIFLVGLLYVNRLVREKYLSK